MRPSARLLKQVRFELRHTGALADSRAVLLALIEATASQDTDPESLMSAEGKAGYIAYRSRSSRGRPPGQRLRCRSRSRISLGSSERRHDHADAGTADNLGRLGRAG
jgi:hypothetical protein